MTHWDFHKIIKVQDRLAHDRGFQYCSFEALSQTSLTLLISLQQAELTTVAISQLTAPDDQWKFRNALVLTPSFCAFMENLVWQEIKA